MKFEGTADMRGVKERMHSIMLMPIKGAFMKVVHVDGNVNREDGGRFYRQSQ